jgi:hypothetical protein
MSANHRRDDGHQQTSGTNDQRRQRGMERRRPRRHAWPATRWYVWLAPELGDRLRAP